MSGEVGREVQEGRSVVNRPLNRFRNITACRVHFVLYVCCVSDSDYLDDDYHISLVPLQNFPECQNDYINASYIDACKSFNYT